VQSDRNASRSGRRFAREIVSLVSVGALLVCAAAAYATPEDAPCTILGTDGADVIHGTSGDDVICGLDGDDQLYGEGGHDVLRGGAGGDRLYGGLAPDQLDGGDGNDRLKGGSGADVFRGGAGWNQVMYWGQRKPVTISIGDGPNDGTAGEGDDVQADVQTIHGGKGDDTLIALREHGHLGFANELWGHGGNDRLVGGNGSDALWGNDGDDTIDTRGDTFDNPADSWRYRDFIRCGNGLDTVLTDPIDSPDGTCENRQ
jgi:Ca2+-binding RTX toxin-like protein